MGLQSRTDLLPDYAEAEFYPMFAPVSDYTIQDAIETRYRDKNITAPADAFAHLQTLIPHRDNAFLFRKN